MSKVNLRLKGGISTQVTRLYTIRGETAAGMELGLKAAALFLREKSKQVVPYDTGKLFRSAYFRKVSGSGFSTKVEVGYTDPKAIFVHEARYRPRIPGRIVKFLEIPKKQLRAQMVAIIRATAQRTIKKGSRASISTSLRARPPS